MGTGVDVALKVFAKSDLLNPDVNRHFENEVAILSDVNHPFIIGFFEVVENEFCKAIVLELAENGCLLDRINKQKLQIDEIKHVFAQLVSAISYLHDTKCVIHGDIKLENVLLDRHMNIRLVDFGFSKKFTRENPWMTGTCGSPAYVAPEIINNEQYTASVDIWSLGVLLYVLCIGHLPFGGSTVSMQLQAVLTTKPMIPIACGPIPSDILKKMLRKEPLKRMKLGEIRSERWIFDELARASRRVHMFTLMHNETDCLLLATMREKGLPHESINESSAAYKELRRMKFVDMDEQEHDRPVQSYRAVTIHRPVGRENENENRLQTGRKARKSAVPAVLRDQPQTRRRPSFPIYTFGDM